jgi:hypothetical protein
LANTCSKALEDNGCGCASNFLHDPPSGSFDSLHHSPFGASFDLYLCVWKMVVDNLKYSIFIFIKVSKDVQNVLIRTKTKMDDVENIWIHLINTNVHVFDFEKMWL